MRIEPEIDRAVLRDIVQASYGIEVDAFTFIPLGEEAACYSVSTNNRRYFLKLWPNGLRYPGLDVIDTSLRLAGALHARGVYPKVPHPICTRDGALRVEIDAGTIAIFPFIDGKPPRRLLTSSAHSGDVTSASLAVDLGRAIASWQIGAAQLADVMPPQDPVTFRFSDHLERDLELVLEHDDLTSIVMPWRDKMLAAHESIERLASAFSAIDDASFVLCHMDLNRCNLLEADDGLYVLDWDGARVAPPEFDLFAGRGPWFDVFMNAYLVKGGSPDIGMDGFQLIALRQALSLVFFRLDAALKGPDEAGSAKLLARDLHALDMIEEQLATVDRFLSGGA